MINEFNTRSQFYCSKKLAYLKINKCGCSSIGNWISKFQTTSPKKPIWNGKNSSYNFHYITEDESELSDFFTFTFVRDPFRRFLSFYKDWIINPPNLGIVKHYEKFGITVNMDFDKFVKAIVNIDDYSLLENHAAPMYTFIFRKNTPRVKFIGKLENINKDMEYLQAISGAKKAIPHSRQSSDERTYYTAETRDLIYNYYRKDFELFGYQYDSQDSFEKDEIFDTITNQNEKGLSAQLAQTEKKLNNIYSSKTYQVAFSFKNILKKLSKIKQ